MIGHIMLGISLGLPVLLGMLWRVKASFIFLSVLSGELLARYFGDEAILAMELMFQNNTVVEYAPFVLLVLPVIFTGFFLRNSFSKGRLWLHVIPLLITGVILTAFSLHELPQDVIDQIASTQYGTELISAQEVIIGTVVILQLIGLWIDGRKKNKHHKKH